MSIAGIAFLLAGCGSNGTPSDGSADGRDVDAGGGRGGNAGGAGRGGASGAAAGGAGGTGGVGGMGGTATGGTAGGGRGGNTAGAGGGGAGGNVAGAGGGGRGGNTAGAGGGGAGGNVAGAGGRSGAGGGGGNTAGTGGVAGRQLQIQDLIVSGDCQPVVPTDPINVRWTSAVTGGTSSSATLVSAVLTLTGFRTITQTLTVAPTDVSLTSGSGSVAHQKTAGDPAPGNVCGEVCNSNARLDVTLSDAGVQFSATATGTYRCVF